MCSQCTEGGCLPIEATSTIIRFDRNPGEQGSVQAQSPCASPYGNSLWRVGYQRSWEIIPGYEKYNYILPEWFSTGLDQVED